MGPEVAIGKLEDGAAEKRAEPVPRLVDQTAVAAGLGTMLLSPRAAVPTFVPTLSLEMAARIRSRVRASVLLTVGENQVIPVDIQGRARGTLQVRTWLAMATMGLCNATRTTFCGGATAGAALLTGGSNGQVYRARDGFVATPTLGAYARLSHPLPVMTGMQTVR